MEETNITTLCGTVVALAALATMYGCNRESEIEMTKRQQIVEFGTNQVIHSDPIMNPFKPNPSYIWNTKTNAKVQKSE